MTRLILFFILHLLVFSILIFTHSKAEEEWSIEEIDGYTYAAVSGEIQHGDKFAFILMPEDNCNKITTMFSFYTWNDPGDYRQLLDKHIPIKLNKIYIKRPNDNYYEFNVKENNKPLLIKINKVNDFISKGVLD